MPENTAQTELAVDTKAPPKAKAAPKTRANAKAKAKAPAKTKAVKSTASKVKVSGVIPMPTKSTTAFKKFETSMEPVMEFNKMIAGSMESSYNMMMDSFQSYAKLGIDSMQSGLKVRTPEDMVSYFETQHAMAQKASDMMMSDAKSFSDLGIKFFNDVRSMYESGVKTSVSAASEAMKAA
jgi:phasin family protein